MKIRTFAAALTTLPGLALAHPQGHEAAGLMQGLLHPISGWDHLLVIAAVALWSARYAMGYRGQITGLFLTALLGGTVTAAALGTDFNLEAMVLASVMLAGGLLLAGKHMGLHAALPLIAVFGTLHGYVHGQELAGQPIAFIAGMLLATAGIQATVYTVARKLRERWITAAGTATTLTGLLALIGG